MGTTSELVERRTYYPFGRARIRLSPGAVGGTDGVLGIRSKEMDGAGGYE